MTTFVRRRTMLGAIAGAAGLSCVNTVSGAGEDDIAEGTTVYVGAHSWIYAIDVASQDVVWTVFRHGNYVRTAPIVVDGMLYAGWRDGSITAIDAATGEREWTYREIEEMNATAPTPTVVDGVVYVDGEDMRVHGIDVETGNGVYRTDVLGRNDQSLSPTVVDDVLYAAGEWTSRRGRLYAYDVTGGEKWEFEEPSNRIRSAPLYYEGTVYVGAAGGTLYAVDAESGEESWSFTEPAGAIEYPPVPVDGTLYLCGDDSNREATVYALDAATGDVEWEHDDPEGQTNAGMAVNEDGSMVYAIADGGRLSALDAATGDREWQVGGPGGSTDDEVAGWNPTTPTVYDGELYVVDSRSGSSTMYALDADTGEKRWSVSDDDMANSSRATVVADPASGHSVGTRTARGMLGHHDGWDGTDPSTGGGGSSDDGDDGIPGFTTAAGAAGVGAGAYLLKRRHDDDQRDR